MGSISFRVCGRLSNKLLIFFVTLLKLSGIVFLRNIITFFIFYIRKILVVEERKLSFKDLVNKIRPTISDTGRYEGSLDTEEISYLTSLKQYIFIDMEGRVLS